MSRSVVRERFLDITASTMTVAAPPLIRPGIPVTPNTTAEVLEVVLVIMMVVRSRVATVPVIDIAERAVEP
jgi:hypothetical protein